MNEILTLPRRRKTDPCRSASDRARRRPIAGVQCEFDETDATRGVPGGPPDASALPAPDGQPAGPGELDRLHASLEGVTAESHPRTAKLLGSGTRKAAQKVIEESGAGALEAVKH